MEILEQLKNIDTWEDYYRYKESSRHSKKSDLKSLRQFIDSGKFRYIVNKVNAKQFDFALPRKCFINKKGTNKKRVVYIFPYEEKVVLQVICFLLGRYDSRFCDNSYAFRMNRSVKDAAYDIRRVKNLKKKYAVKIDIHDYFNSIPDEELIEKLKQFINDDQRLLDFLIRLYGRKEVILEDEIISQNHGAMAGTPLSGFMANVYLTDIDFDFYYHGIPYFRYSDDVIIFTDTVEEREQVLSDILVKIEAAGLGVNPDKFMMTSPSEEWDYLGFSYIGGEYDLSRGTILKTKQKIKRYARYLYRKRSEKGWSYEETAKRLLKRFNKIFYDENEENEFCWCRWYFTIVTATNGFHIIDEYLQEYLRYLYSGRHYKGNYKIEYGKLKELGYRSLVAEYYKYKNNKMLWE